MNNHLILNRVFSKKTIRDLLVNGESEVLNLATNKYINDGEILSNVEKISGLYSILEKKYRNEYFYKNTMLNKLLLGRHSLNTTTALSEVWLNHSKADFVLINGKAIVYEIKTELDNLSRLQHQVADYYKVFDHVEIITDESHLLKVKNEFVKTSVGISIISKKKTIQRVQEPISYTQQLDYMVIYKLLRKEERKNILSLFYESLPQVDAFSEFQLYFELFSSVSMNILYPSVLNELKKRGSTIRNNAEVFLQIPYELKALLYFSPVKSNELQRLNSIMKEG